MIKYQIILVIFLTSWILITKQNVCAQELDTLKRHQVGINASAFFNQVFRSQTNSFDINYNLFINPKNALRTGLNYYQITTNDGYTDLSVKIGYQRLFLNKKKWAYYFGFDILSGYTYYKSSKKENLKIGISPMFGISLKIGNSFLLTTEPNIFFIYNRYIDNDTFSADNKKIWFEKGLDNIGHIQLTFHF